MYRVYLNINPEEAERRFKGSDDFIGAGYEITTFEFDDEFGAYAVWLNVGDEVMIQKGDRNG
jgi:hypothetical protein